MKVYQMMGDDFLKGIVIYTGKNLLPPPLKRGRFLSLGFFRLEFLPIVDKIFYGDIHFCNKEL